MIKLGTNVLGQNMVGHKDTGQIVDWWIQTQLGQVSTPDLKPGRKVLKSVLSLTN